ncbi:MAG: hydroxymethylpyrimidine/phosphomethylpyrimidine kinase [Muribaculaceae bacterium]|nr:hydroxymethylpyrimidine/phosphomethylpyrimidine kinase [Muribaculaceae bacterium]
MALRLNTLLSIAGSDPLGGAGIQADIKAAASCGVHAMTALTSVTVQNSRNFIDLGILSPKTLKNQLEVIIEDVIPDAIKIGMIGSIQNLLVIEEFLNKVPDVPVVIDPILKSTISAKSLCEGEEEYKEKIKENLFPKATVITPNYSEFIKMGGSPNFREEEPADILASFNTNAIIITGVENKTNNSISDYLIHGDEITHVSHKKKECINLHGTGCVYSTLMACFLSKGAPLDNAFYSVSNKINEIINKSCNYSLGDSKYGPLNILDYTWRS